MRTKQNIRKIAELGIGMTAIAALILAGCGGGGGGGGSAASGIPMSVTPALGQFKKDSHVLVYDKTGNVIGTGLIDASGVAAFTIPSGATGPFLIGAGTNNDKYYDEKSAGFRTITGLATDKTTAIHAVIPNSAASSVAVTPLTEMAAALLTNASGVLSAGVTAASAVGANVTIAANIAQKLGLPPGASILTPPTPVAASGVALGVTDGDKYAKVLATLAHLNVYGPGLTPLEIAHKMRDDAADGKFDGSVVSGVAAASGVLDADVASANTAASAKYTGTAPVVAALRTDLDLKAAMEAADVEDEAIANTAASTFSNVFAASGVQAATTAAASAVATATQVAAAATPISAAKTLLTSLRTNANLLHNTGNTGFIDQQFTAAQADFNSLSGSLHGFSDLQHSILGGLNLLRTNAPVGTSTNAGGVWVGNVCKVTAAGTATCQWLTSHQAGWAAHQLTLTKTGTTTYTWKDSLIGAGAWTTFPPALYGNAVTPMSNNVEQIGTITAVYGASSWTTLNLSGNAQSPFLPTSVYHHTAIALNGGVVSSGGNDSLNLTGSISEINSSGTPLVTLALNSGTSIVGNSTTGAPVSASFVLQAQTVHYQFDGTLNMSGFAQDSTTMCASWGMSGCTSRAPNKQWYAGTTSFTGNVSHRTDTTIGNFMTGTLTATLDESNFDSSQPVVANTNNNAVTMTFDGSITNRTVTPAMVYRVAANSSQPKTTLTAASSLTYTDPGNNTVTVTWTGTWGTPGSVVGPITMGSIRIENGNVYSGTTLIGTVSGPIVNFIDGTFVSLQ